MSAKSGDPLFADRASAPGQMPDADSPLASRMRPRNLDEFVGQDHIVGPGRLLRRAIQKDQLSSLLFSGPPGTGKTTLARVIANSTKSRFISLNAVLTGVADIRLAIEEARRHRELYDRKTILFVDEVHRWNKSQQDALLPWVENGTVILIGATTENPFFEVNKALVSRSRVFLLRSLGEEDLRRAARMALSDPERGYGLWRVRFAEGALEHLVSTADGDARSLLNALELAVETSVDHWPPPEGSDIDVSMAAAEESIQRRAVLYDKDGDYHYDAISAFIKSIRGSDPDAALYWLARMVYSGEDPHFAFRRMLIAAAEDIGLADPAAIGVVTACAQAFDRVGMPEGQFHLAQAALYLAAAPKSNSALGYFDALKAVEESSAEVPDHLKDANRDAKGFGHGEGYQYPHAYKDHWVAQQYLPDTLTRRIFYNPGSLGFEATRREEILSRREAQLAFDPQDADSASQSLGSSLGQSPGPRSGASVWSQEGEQKTRWMARAEGAAAERLRSMRTALFDSAAVSRDDRILVLDARRGFYALEALRRSPEGTVCVLLPDNAAKAQASHMVEHLSELARPLYAVADPSRSIESTFESAEFDLVLACELLGGPDSPDRTLEILSSLATGQPKTQPLPAIIALELLKGASAGLAGFLRLCPKAPNAADAAFVDALAAFEKTYGGGPAYRNVDMASLDEEKNRIVDSYRRSLGPHLTVGEITCTYGRSIGSSDIDMWLSPDSDYAKALRLAMGQDALSRLRALLISALGAVPDADSKTRSQNQWPIKLLVIQAGSPQAFSRKDEKSPRGTFEKSTQGLPSSI